MKQWRKGDKITTLKELWERISGGGYVYYRDEVISPEVAKTLQAEDVEEAVLKEGRYSPQRQSTGCVLA